MKKEEVASFCRDLKLYFPISEKNKSLLCRFAQPRSFWQHLCVCERERKREEEGRERQRERPVTCKKERHRYKMHCWLELPGEAGLSVRDHQLS